MANLPESPVYDEGIYLIELTDPVVGGVDGISNKQAKGLGNRTAYLKAQMEALVASKAPLASPALTGTPTVPTAANGTNTTQAASTAFVNNAVAGVGVSLLSSAAPANLADTPAAGSAVLAARGDHVHALPPVATVSSKGLMSASDKVNLDAAAPLVSPAFSGTPTVPTAPAGANTTQIASTAFVKTAINALLGAVPFALNTLEKLSAAIGNDANFFSTVMNALALKAPLASPALTGTPTVPTAANGTNTTQAASTAFVTGAINSLPLTKAYTSAELSLATGALYTLTHYLGAAPRLYETHLKCVKAGGANGFSFGQVFKVDIGPFSGNHRGCVIWSDNTSINIRMAAGGGNQWESFDPTTGTRVVLADTDFKLIVTAFG